MALDRIQYLLEQQLERPLTPGEHVELSGYCEQQADAVVSIMAMLLEKHAATPVHVNDQATMRLFRSILDSDSIPATASPLQVVSSQPGKVRQLATRWFAVAAVLILLAAGIFYLVSQPKPKASVLTSEHPDIKPGQDGAILTLADGRTVVLEGMQDGTLIGEHNANIRFRNNQLVYTATGEISHSKSPVKNTLTTPRGRQFNLVLPDGSKVWLNAASSITYPAVFDGEERVVELTGEAYFDVAQHAAQPFIVRARDTRVMVLGTQLNVKAYREEEELLTTLVEGAVRVQRGSQAFTLKPGNQTESGKGFTLHENGDVEAAIAWKNGKFHFGDNATIQNIMLQVANWYDVEVVYKGEITEHIGGTVARNVSLSELLKVLEATGLVKFKVAGRRIEVSPA